MTQTKRSASLSKGLRVLRCLNQRDDVSVLEISRQTEIPRTTLYRILNTLVHDGYIARGGRGNTYKLTIDVGALSAGYRDEEWVSSIAAPLLTELGHKIVWPVGLATLDSDHILVRFTTHQSSPMSLERSFAGRRGYAGYRVPVLTSACGLIYLAVCSSRRRNTILSVLRQPGHAEHDVASDKSTVDHLLKMTRRQGYGTRLVGDFAPGTGTISIPVMFKKEPIACINVSFIVAALPLADATEQFLDVMRQTASVLEAALTDDQAHKRQAVTVR